METICGISIEELRKRYGFRVPEGEDTPEAKKRNLSERATLLQEMIDEVNKERSTPKFYLKNGKKVWIKPITTPADKTGFAVKFSHIKKTNDLYYLKSICLDYRSRHGSFSKCLFGSIKAK